MIHSLMFVACENGIYHGGGRTRNGVHKLDDGICLQTSTQISKSNRSPERIVHINSIFMFSAVFFSVPYSMRENVAINWKSEMSLN